MLFSMLANAGAPHAEPPGCDEHETDKDERKRPWFGNGADHRSGQARVYASGRMHEIPEQEFVGIRAFGAGRAIEVAESGCAIAEAVGELGLRVVANHYLGMALRYAGDPRSRKDSTSRCG
jgi:hypothetical protein